MKGLFIKMRELQGAASPTEQTILQYLLDSPEDVLGKSIHDLARFTYTSPSTIVRFCRKLGFDGYKDFRLTLSSELALRQKDFEEKRKSVTEYDTLPDIVDKVIGKTITSLQDSRSLIEYEMLEKAIDMICDCRTVVFFGAGASLLAARDAYLKFLRIGKAAVINDDWSTQLVQARNMTPDDLGFVLSYSGQTTEVIACIEALKQSKVPIITITRYGPSPIVSLSDCPLYVVGNESLFRRGAMSSRIAQLTMIDILYTAYVNRHYEAAMERLSATHILKPEGEYST